MSKRVLLGVTGSIAAFKAAELVRLLQQEGREVRVVMTRGGTEFITPLTFKTLTRHEVGIDMFAEHLDWHPEHISLADWADLMVMAPCTANVLAKLAHGIADDLLTCTALAVTEPLIIAPAMNDRMWDHAATQANVATLRERGNTLVEVGSGDLACGYQGRGRMAALEDIMQAIRTALHKEGTA